MVPHQIIASPIDVKFDVVDGPRYGEIEAYLLQGTRRKTVGKLSVKWTETAAIMFDVSVHSSVVRKGIATRMYEVAAKLAAQHGLPLRSDISRHPGAEGFWKKQVAKGRAVAVHMGPNKVGVDPNKVRYYQLNYPPPPVLAEVIEAGHLLNLSPEGSAKGRVKERRQASAFQWLEAAVLQAAKDMYASWKRKGGPEPSLTTSLLRELAIEGTGGLPDDIKWMSKRQQDLAVLNILQKLKRKGLMEVSTGAGQRGGEAKVWNPVSASQDVIATLLALADYFNPDGTVSAAPAYNAKARYKALNDKLFEGKLPDIPVTMRSLKRVGGKAMAQVFRDASGKEHLVPNSIKIVLDSTFKRTPEQFDAILVHEMIHVYHYIIGNLSEQHGHLFEDMAKKLGNILGITIPLKDEVKDLDFDDEKAGKPVGVVMMRISNRWTFALMNEKSLRRHLFALSGRSRGPKLIGVSKDPFWQRKAQSMSEQRTTKLSFYFVPDGEEAKAEDILRKGEILLDQTQQDQKVAADFKRPHAPIPASVVACGDCFRYATSKARELGDDAVVVHAVVINTDPQPGERSRYEHAWVEYRGKVYDWQTEHFRRQPMAVTLFYKERKPTQAKRYTAEEAMLHGLRSGHHGPWHNLRASVVTAFKRPFDAWKRVKPGRQPLPQPLEGHEKAWRMIAKRLGVDTARGVWQLAPVIGGRRRYHHRPLSSWLLPDKKTTLTITSDKLEAQSWNRLKNKRHVAMPRVYDVFELRLSGVQKPLWAIVHERVTWPIDPDWEMFVDSFFRWRAMQKDALRPAEPSDLEGFLRFIIDPERSDPVTVRRKRIETALPFQMMNERRHDVAQRRKRVWKDPGLEDKIAWAKSTLKFLKANKVKHRDLDPSNLGKTLKGRTVVTNIAESRSKGKSNIGRLGRVSSAAEPVKHDPFGPTPAAPALRTAQAINFLLDPEAPLMESMQLLSGETRTLHGRIHNDSDMLAAVQEAAFQVGFPQESVLRGLEKLTDLAESNGGKAVKIAEEVLARVKAGPAPIAAASWVEGAGRWRKVKTPEQRSQAAQKAAKTRKARQVPIDLKINGIPIAGAYYPSWHGKVEEGRVYFTSKRALRRLADLPMVRAYRYTDDYAWDSDTNFGKGATTTLGELLAGSVRLLSLDFYKASQRKDEKQGWYMSLSPHANESWDSAEALEVQVRKSEVPAPVELPPMPKLAASFSGRKKAKRRAKVQEVVDALVNVAEYLR